MKKLLFTLAGLLLLNMAVFPQLPPLPCDRPLTVTGPDTACLGNELEYATEIPNANWSVNGGSIIFDFWDRKVIRWTAAGARTITVTCGSYSGSLTVNVGNTGPPPLPSSITGTSSLCPNTTATYSVALQSSYTHVWQIEQNGVVVTDLNTSASGNQFTVDWQEGGQYVIKSFLSNGYCTGPVQSLAVTVQTAPDLTIAKYSAKSCTYTYVATSTTVADSYHWSVSGGATIETLSYGAFITWPGPGTYTVSVYGSNSCYGNGPVTSITEVVDQPPTLEVRRLDNNANNGHNSCVGTTDRFSVIGAASHDLYDWTLSGGGSITPQPNGTVTVNWTQTGSFTVTASIGSCFTSTSSSSWTQNVGVEPQIGPINSPDGVCANIYQMYYVDPVPGALGYFWSGDGSFSQQYDRSQTYRFAGAGTYTVGVNVRNEFCTALKTKSVTVASNNTNLPAPIINGPPSLCINAATNISYTGQSGFWRADDPAAVVLSPQPPDNTQALATFNIPGQHKIYLNYNSNGCTSPTATKTVTVETVPVPAINGDTWSICQNGTARYTTDPGKLYYQWEAPLNAILSGQGTPSVTVRWINPGTQTIKVNYSNGLNCFAPTPTVREVEVLAAEASVTPVGPTAICTSGSVVLSANTGPGLTYQWRSILGNIAGATGSTYTATSSDNYRVLVTHPGGCSQLSNTVAVVLNTVNAGSIWGNQTICSGSDPVAFTENGSYGSGTLSYEWQSSTDGLPFTAINEATGITYDAPPGLTQTTSYVRKTTSTLYGVDCSAVSNVQTITVNSSATTVTADPKTLCLGGSVVLTGSPAGGAWSGTGVTGSTFNSTGLTAGNHTVTYSYTGDNCTTTATAIMTVIALPAVTADPKTVCQGNSVTLTGSPAGGIWSGTGVSGSVFSSAGMSPGNYTVNYTYTNSNNCTNTASATITVNALPVVSAEPKSVCVGNSVTLTGLPSGGSWSGTGVTGSTFSSSGLSAGNYTVTYSYSDPNGCVNTASASVTVNPLPTVTADPKSVCSGSSVALTGFPAGGTWSGSGVNGSNFSAVGLSAGNYVVSYSYTDPNNCTNTATATITVHAMPVVSADDKTVCQGNSVALTGLPAGGTWGGTGVNQSTFNSSGLSAGNHTVTYSYTNSNGCTKSDQAIITVYALPSVVADDKSVCAGNSVALSATPAGGTWSGTGVEQSTFNSSGLPPGNHTVTYSYTNSNGCTKTDPAIITVYALPAISAEDKSVCTGNSVALSGTPVGGTWSGTGVVGSTFNSSGLSIGTYAVNYSYTNLNGCTSTDGAVITVSAYPTVIADNKTVCQGNTITLTGSPAGGAWSGTGVSGSTFSSVGLATGAYTVNYTYTNSGGCASTSSATVSVNALPSVTASNKTVCQAASVALTGSPTGGTWSGTGVSGSYFNATGLSAGAYTVYYSITGSNGCTNTASATVTVKPIPVILSFSGTPGVCPGNVYTYSVSVSGTGHTYAWTKPTNWSIQNQSGNSITLYVPQNKPKYGAVRVTVSSGGCTAQDGMTVYPGSCGGASFYSVSPNPANAEMTVELSEPEETDSPVNIFSTTGKHFISAVIEKGRSTQIIDTSALPNGVYIMEVKKMYGASEYKRIVVAH